MATDECRFYGSPLTGFERDKYRLDHARRWVFCLHTFAPLGLYVCRCQGCGSTCPGFASPQEYDRDKN